MAAGCQPGGRVGSSVLVPSGDNGEEIAVRILLAHDGRSIDECRIQLGVGCIVARRALRYTPHSNLILPVVLRRNCDGIACDATHTCVQGECKLSACEGEGCAAIDPANVASLDAAVPSDAGDRRAMLDVAVPSDVGNGDATLDGPQLVSATSDGTGHWEMMSSAPRSRSRHAAFWTGRENYRVGRGTDNCGNPYCLDGDRYDPMSDRWGARIEDAPINTTVGIQGRCGRVAS